jgi:hypothetical protein
VGIYQTSIPLVIPSASEESAPAFDFSITKLQIAQLQIFPVILSEAKDPIPACIATSPARHFHHTS